MKKILLKAIAIIALCSCNQASELPPINEEYASSFILPDPVDLTQADKDFINALNLEYNNAIK